MKLSAVISVLETLAPPSLQESYDNCGLLTGDPSWNCNGVLCTLDATEEIVDEAVRRGCNLIVAHHPIVFTGLKRINGKNYVERTVIKAIKHDIAIYAIHTSLDNVAAGVNGRIADRLGLMNRSVLAPREKTLRKLYTFVPLAAMEAVRTALFAAGAGHIGRYSETSFGVEGKGTFKAGEGASPFVGAIGERHEEAEIRLEVIFPAHLQGRVIDALWAAHPYEEVAYDVVELTQSSRETGSGLVGELPEALSPADFLALLKKTFLGSVVRHSALTEGPIRRVALCGGAGSFLISKALQADAQAFVTADLKYHEFFDAERRLLLCDVGHFESEQFTTDLLAEVLQQKFTTFAVLKSDINTNPVYYYF